MDYMNEQCWESSDKTEELARLRDAMKPEERSRYDGLSEKLPKLPKPPERKLLGKDRLLGKLGKQMSNEKRRSKVR